MNRRKEAKTTIARRTNAGAYNEILADVVMLLEGARHTSARAVNAVMTATYWTIERRIVEGEQGGWIRAAYGEELIEKRSRDLTARFGRGFGRRNLFQMRAFYLAYAEILQTTSAQSEHYQDDPRVQTASAISTPTTGGLAVRFPLPWSQTRKILEGGIEGKRPGHLGQRR